MVKGKTKPSTTRKDSETSHGESTDPIGMEDHDLGSKISHDQSELASSTAKAISSPSQFEEPAPSKSAAPIARDATGFEKSADSTQVALGTGHPSSGVPSASARSSNSSTIAINTCSGSRCIITTTTITDSADASIAISATTSTPSTSASDSGGAHDGRNQKPKISHAFK